MKWVAPRWWWQLKQWYWGRQVRKGVRCLDQAMTRLGVSRAGKRAVFRRLLKMRLEDLGWLLDGR